MLLPRFVLLEGLRYNLGCHYFSQQRVQIMQLRLLRHPRPSTIDIDGFSSNETAVGEDLAVRSDSLYGLLAGGQALWSMALLRSHKIVNELIVIRLIASRTPVSLLTLCKIFVVQYQRQRVLETCCLQETLLRDVSTMLVLASIGLQCVALVFLQK